MRVLVVGSGGREHALCWKIAQSPSVERVFCAPGNAGTAGESGVENVDIAAGAIDQLADWAGRQKIGLTVVGPELPLVGGIVDHFRNEGLVIFGPTSAAARLEGSKSFAKDVLREAQVATAESREFDDAQQAKEYVRSLTPPIVVKADGLAAGKGVVICQSLEEALQTVDCMMEERSLGEAGGRLLVEQFLAGAEVSVLGLCCGDEVHLLQPARDHKPLLDGGKGPNTGGMGAFTPVPGLSQEWLERIREQVFLPVLRTMITRGSRFTGVLYAGLMLVDAQPYVLEFNVRLGDPEAQPLLYHLKSDLVPYLENVARDRLPSPPPTFHSGSAMAVVLASEGYPGSYRKGIEIDGLDKVDAEDVKVFHAGTRVGDGGKVVTSGGRVMAVTARGEDLAAVREKCYGAVSRVGFSGAQFRSDIGI